ncbi:MAG: UvrD-helicase domain-containing protein [Dehalococcoidia bacterium]|nr:UvrD-helicase domain-containing protein [Dehalococcoidia bacterium]
MTAPDFTPGDALERLAIRDGIDDNMCVEAGAGTGKTTVLVDRIVEIVRSGHARVQEIAVITFTEKAAAELAARVREQLERARGAEATPDVERARFAAALRDLSRAHTETIHAFAAGLLRELPVEAGVDPGFQVLSDLPAQLAFETAYDEWMAAEMAAEPPPALIDALNLGLEYASVREAAESLQRHRDLLPLRRFAEREAAIEGLLAHLAQECETLARLEPRAIVETDEALAALRRVLEMRRTFEALRGRPQSLRRAIATAPRELGSRGNQQHWRHGQDCRDVKAALKRTADDLQACADALKQTAAARLLVWLQGFVRAYDERRKAAGQADFDDVLIWARDLVRDNAEARAYFAAQYRCILVDEFQDTDPLQAELILRICSDGTATSDWRRARLRPGSLFVVGDPKQSIYRFRRADIAMYDDVKQHVFGGEVRRIVQNFRSGAPIIDWVNRVFGELIAGQPGVQPAYVALTPHPAYAGRGAVDLVRRVVPVAGRQQARQLRVAEANAVASMIAVAVADGAWPLRSGRPARYRDIVVLIPSRAELDTYEDAFARAGVPYRHEGGRTFFLRQEVRELVAILRAIDDPADEVAAVAALRSSAFGLSDEDLLLYAAAGGRFDQRRLRTAASGAQPDGEGDAAAARVREAWRLLEEMRALRHVHILPDVVRTVLDRTQLVEAAMLRPQGEQVAANLLKLIDEARAFSGAAGGGLRGFVRWLKENMARTSDETDALISEETDDVVRVLTVHASKGLEFPVVVFANMGTERSNRTRVIAERASGRLHARFGKSDARFATPGWDEALGAEQPHDDAEQCRMLYVAATRAQDRLVVPVFVASAKPPARHQVKSSNDLLRQAPLDDRATLVDGAAIEAPAAELPLWRRAAGASGRGEAAVAGVREARERWRHEHAALIAEASAPLDVRTATALKPAWEHAGGDDEVRRGRATDFGIAVHALLERIDLARPDDAGVMAPAIAAEFGLLGREQEVAQVAGRALRSPVVARALASGGRVLRELAFTAPLPPHDRNDGGGGGLAEGRIDLLFSERDDDGDAGIVIVDFKTDAVTAREVDERAAQYRNQMLVYGWAAERATGLPVREVVFLFARPGIERATVFDAALRAEAAELLSNPQTQADGGLEAVGERVSS